MLTCASGRIKALHQFLVVDFAPSIVGRATIDLDPRSRGRLKWDASNSDGDVYFELWPQDYWETATAAGRIGTPVVQLSGFNPERVEIGWVSWRERWNTERGSRDYRLLDAAFTFYWGRITAVSDIIFRAEWPSEDIGAEGAAHPHWQFDMDPHVLGLTVERIHFGMAGWELPGEHGWRRFPEDTETVRIWATKTLKYARDQLSECPLLRQTDAH